MNKMDHENSTIAVLGLGYIGLPFTAALANVGYNVIGVDVNKERIDMLKRGEVPFYEPGMRETLEINKGRVEYTYDYPSAIKRSDVLFVTVGTPLRNDETPDYSQIDSCMAEIGKSLKLEQLVMLKSTVVVGTTENHVIPMLEKTSGLKAGKDFYLAFCPERTIEGQAMHEIYNLPKIIGGINAESSARAEKIMKRLGSKVHIVSSPKVAEMCKLADNLYRATNIAFANEVGLLCENLGINAKEMVTAVNCSYNRTNIFSPGLGADGPCLSKDPFIFRHSAHQFGMRTPVADGCIEQNKFATYRIVDIVKDFMNKNKMQSIDLSVIGLAFKGFPETDDLRGSPAEKLINALKKEKGLLNSVRVYDPLVRKFDDLRISESVYEAVEGSNVALFLTNHPRIMNQRMDGLVERMKSPGLIVDAWGNIVGNKKYESISYFRIGDGKNNI